VKKIGNSHADTFPIIQITFDNFLHFYPHTADFY